MCFPDFIYALETMALAEKQHVKVQVQKHMDKKNRGSKENRQDKHGRTESGSWSEGQTELSYVNAP